MSAANTNTRMPAFGSRQAMALLWDKATRELGTHELRWFAEGARNQVAEDAQRLEAVLTGVACLVLGDADEDGARVGSFQEPEDVANLLHALAGQMGALAGLAEIADDASRRVLELSEAGERPL